MTPSPIIKSTSDYYFVDTGDRYVSVVGKIDKPNIVVLENFISDSECDALIEMAKPRMSRS